LIAGRPAVILEEPYGPGDFQATPASATVAWRLFNHKILSESQNGQIMVSIHQFQLLPVQK
jgi:hypothetical protein